ncbi:MopE-related protein [Polyangium aurulentum]|uniref:MopE-related protein n=1 Tax=Polyangium aurulentum TaxID=2567896 RepID=UPI0010AE831D|nr:MopE-related protein [Polyangium aurulentum]UQA54943.1 hypothetical protein E8A73_026660 [Polyangium aurulentum]
MSGFHRLLGTPFLGLKVAAFGVALATAALGTRPAQAEPAACLSFDPAQWPAPSKPYFMIAFDTSSSMTGAVASNNSCNYPNDRVGHGRCAVKNTLLAFAGQANFGLATFAKTLKNCTGACFTSCNALDFPGNSGLAGCGPEPTPCGNPPVNEPNSGCRQGANIVVPMLVDNFYSPPPNPSNITELLKWVDNDCSDQKELFPIGNTPLNGILRDMYRYYSNQWAGPGNVPLYTSPLADLAQGERACRSVNVILVTDGDESCDLDPTDPVDAAADLFAGVTKGGITWKIKTHVIAFGGGTINKANQIAAAGGTSVAQSAADEAALSQALSNIISSAVKPETCNNGDDNCNGCTDEGFKHYCDVGQACCSWSTQAQRATCLAKYQSTISAANPSGDLAELPCTTAAQQQDPATWLCFNPKETCDNADNNCSDGVDEGVLKCGSPAHCPKAEVCDGLDDDCDGVVDEGVCQGCQPSPEVCDGCDNDCNGIADDGIAPIACGQPNPPNCAGTLSCKAPQNVPLPGACVAGGGFNTCQTNPQAETCDGLDNDCDGAVDDSVTPTACVPAGTPSGLNYGPNSQCKQGTQPCGGTCQGFVGPGPEICDGIDNDCDGQVDESAFGVGTPCGVNQPPCKTGLTACVNGALVCQGGTQPQAEVCDGTDNDCDGSVDETPLADAPPAGGNGCWTLPGNCCTFGNLTWCAPDGADCKGNGTLSAPCNAGKLVCQGAQKWVCAGAKEPSPEACDGLDNNCNAQVDEGNIPQVGMPCGSDTGECVLGGLACNAGVLDCVGDVGPMPETCDGLDNDCDGQIDNGVLSGGTCSAPYDVTLYPGPRDNPPCIPGMLACDGSGGATCEGAIGPSPEICDGIDNDCDGQIDENGPAPDGINGSANPLPDPAGANIGDKCGQNMGVCAEGVYACVNGKVVCVGGQQATDEACDCDDNDCDGSSDEQDPNAPPICSTGKECVKSGSTCACAAKCGQGEFPCPPGQKCEQVTASDDGQPLGFYCVPDNCGDCSKKTVKDANGNVICAPSDTPADANCNKPPVCVCRGQAGCRNPCDGTTCPAGEVCSDIGPNAGKCVVDNCYNVPCPGCNKACNLGSCLDNPCKADTCPSDQACKPNGDFTTFTCVATCANVTCAEGQACKDGLCVATCDPACASGETCDTTGATPVCVANKCTTACSNGGCCDPLTGACGNCPCEGVVCPQGQACKDGQCDDGGTGGSGGAGGAGGSSSATGSGGANQGGSNGTGADDTGVFGLPTGGGGCSCEVAGDTRSEAGWLAIFGMSIVFLRRRRTAARIQKEVA